MAEFMFYVATLGLAGVVLWSLALGPAASWWSARRAARRFAGQLGRCEDITAAVEGEPR